MNQELWEKFDRLRTLPYSGYEHLAQFFKKEEIRFSPRDLGTWGKFWSARLGGAGGTVYVPEWLAKVFSAFAKAYSPKSILDPWAGVGFLAEVLRDACDPTDAIALTQISAEYELGRILAPDVQWQLGDPLVLLGQTAKEFDLIASILPMGMRHAKPLIATDVSGRQVELRDDLGNLVLVASALHLGPAGIGLFVVTPSFFFSRRSVFARLGELGLGVQAALGLPSGTFAPYTNIPTFLLVVARKPADRMFVAELSSDEKTNFQIITNLEQGQEGGSLDMGRFVEPSTFTSIEAIRTADRLREAERRFGAPAVALGEFATAFNLGRFGDDFTFQPHDNSLFIPLLGNSDVVDSPSDLTLKKQNYAQVVIDPARSNARFVARFFNSELGKEIRQQGRSGAVIPRLNMAGLRGLRVFVPDLQTQRRLMDIEGRVFAEQNTLRGLQNELAEYRRELWASPGTAASVEQRLNGLSKRLGAGVDEHAAQSLEQWFETLPFPLASILRAWQATPTEDFKTKYEHLLHFFQATAEFVSVILLSAFGSNEALFAPHKQKLAEAMEKQNLSFQRATFGTWKLVVEYLGKQTRELLSKNGKKPEDAQDDEAICADIFADQSLQLPEALARKELAGILSATNKMRNDWSGHTGVVGQEEARLRNAHLLAEVQKLREAVADTWSGIQLIHALHCRPRRGLFENEVAILMGSNSEFLKETRSMATWLDVERLYLSRKEATRALKLMPLVQVGSSPTSAKNACYFFDRLERDGAARFVSYHFTEKPEVSGEFTDAADTIKLLTQL